MSKSSIAFATVPALAVVDALQMHHQLPAEPQTMIANLFEPEFDELTFGLSTYNLLFGPFMYSRRVTRLEHCWSSNAKKQKWQKDRIRKWFRDGGHEYKWQVLLMEYEVCKIRELQKGAVKQPWFGSYFDNGDIFETHNKYNSVDYYKTKGLRNDLQKEQDYFYWTAAHIYETAFFEAEEMMNAILEDENIRPTYRFSKRKFFNSWFPFLGLGFNVFREPQEDKDVIVSVEEKRAEKINAEMLRNLKAVIRLSSSEKEKKFCGALIELLALGGATDATLFPKYDIDIDILNL